MDINATEPQHPVEQFWHLIEGFGVYPDGVIPIPERIPGTAFFPGGSGLWNTQPSEPLPPFPIGGVMIVGHNFDSVASYERSLLRGLGENLKGPSWANILGLLMRAQIAPEQCFFTNAYIGLNGGSSAMGEFPGAHDSEFVRRCRELLAEEIRVMQPRVIATLGIYVPPFLAPLAPQLREQWSGLRSLKAIDQKRVALVPSATFAVCPEPIAVVALTHPAYRRLNIHHRYYGNLRGDDAEVQLLRDALNGTW